MTKNNLIEVIHEMEEVTKLFKLVGYPAKYGKVFVLNI